MEGLAVTSHIVARRQVGLSLVELMIALVLGTILTLGVTQVFLGSSQTYRTSEAVSLLQENLRFSLSRVSRDVRMAGYYGCLIGDPTEHLDTNNAAYNSDIFDFDRAVVGWEAPNTGLSDQYGIASLSPGGGGWTNATADGVPPVLANRAIPGTDIIVLSGGVRADVVLAGNPSPPATTIGTNVASGISQGTIMLVVAEDCSGGDRFQKSNNADAASLTKGAGGSPGNNMGPDVLEHTDESSVFTYQSIAYFVGQGVGGGPSLFQVRLDPGAANVPEELITGVENMQVLYGLRQDPNDPRAQRYVPADAVNDWADVVSVRFGILMRSNDNILDGANIGTFNLVGTEVDPGADRRARLVGTMTVALRNRLN